MEKQIHKRVAIELNVKGASIKIGEPTELIFEWVRGTKSIESKAVKTNPEDPYVKFNEKF